MASACGFSFETVRVDVAAIFQNAVVKDDCQEFIDKAQPFLIPGCESDIKNIVDQAIRDVLKDFLLQKASSKLLERVLSYAIDAALKDICSGSLPVLVLSDMFDCSTLDECETIFTFVENRVEVLKKDIFFKNCKNQLLRSCNDLLRRLSRSQNTVFCGRILLFLARIFPLSERSGLNIISEFNLDNTTLFSTKDDGFSDANLDKDDSIEEGEISARPITVDYNLYRKFWSLQEFFRQPNSCYNKVYWRHFTTYASDILSAFSSFKLDDANSPKWKLSEAIPSSSGRSVYFAKYLTSPKLLELELSDSNFRRYVLIQFLILFQYLTSPVKFKLETFILTEEQQTWIKETAEKIYRLLEETPPSGTGFSQNVANILKREEYWNAWKNEGCPDFKDVEDKGDMKPIRQKRRLGDEMKIAHANNKVLVGNSELNRLWNLCPDNWEACRSPKRDFVPSLDTFFEAAIEQADPANQIENRYKKVYESNYGWRALRLLSQKSPHFFTHSNQPIKNLPNYLESMVLKLAKERPLSQMQQENLETKTEVTSVAGDTAEDSDDELLKNSEDANIKDDDKSKKANSNTVNRALLESLAERLLGKWKVLAPKLGFQEDEIFYYETEYSSVVDQGRQMLIVWMEQDSEGGTVASLRAALEKVGLLNLALPVLQAAENGGRSSKS